MNNREKEITLKDIVERTKQVVRYLLSKWVIIVIVGILGGTIGLIYAWNFKPRYSAALNFVLSANSSSGGGGLMGLANQFGINIGNDNNNVFSGDNIIVLMVSRRMVQQALFGKPGGRKESLINFFIKDNKMDEDWKDNQRTKNAYPFPDDANAMTMVQDSLARTIYKAITTSVLEVSKPDKNQSIYTVKSTSTNEFFSYYLTKFLVVATSAFYIKTKTSTAKQNLDMLQHEADSLRILLGGVITSAGSQTDVTFNLNPAYQVQRSGALQSQARATALGQAYGQVLQSLEIAKITLQKEMPLYQIIDEPTLPLEKEKPGRLMSLIIGGFIGGLLICGVLLAIKAYKIFI
jgi:uncharacterized protein involved in exopolysaccharide biosynthesis